MRTLPMQLGDNGHDLFRLTRHLLHRARLVLILGMWLAICCARSNASEESPAEFRGKDTLLLPVGYREWVFVGSSLGLRYRTTVDSDSREDQQSYKNIYIDPASYRHFARTGIFREGTIMILEAVRAERKNEPGLQGSYQAEFTGLEASVKDSARFADGWAYFSFDLPGGKRAAQAQPLPAASCVHCHREKGGTDHVFTQFYPVLRSLMRDRQDSEP